MSNDRIETDPSITPEQAQLESDESIADSYAEEMKGGCATFKPVSEEERTHENCVSAKWARGRQDRLKAQIEALQAGFQKMQALVDASGSLCDSHDSDVMRMVCDVALGLRRGIIVKDPKDGSIELEFDPCWCDPTGSGPHTGECRAKRVEWFSLLLPEPNWRDTDDEYTKQIDEAFPTRSHDHSQYGKAMRMVGNRNSKHSLVSLVNWLLMENAKK